MLEKKPKQNNKPLSRYYLCRIQKLRNITNQSLKFSAPDLEHGKTSLSVPGCWGDSAEERPHGHREKGLIAASSSNSYWSKVKPRDFCSALAAFHSLFLLVQSSAQAPEPQRIDPCAPTPRSAPDLWRRVFCLPAHSTVGWTSLHTVSRLWNASDLASDTRRVTNYRAQWEEKRWVAPSDSPSPFPMSLGKSKAKLPQQSKDKNRLYVFLNVILPHSPAIKSQKIEKALVLYFPKSPV